MVGKTVLISELNERARAVFRTIVDDYVATGEPVGSRTVAQHLDPRLSPASVRNVMADLEAMGLLRAPHTSAGRVPTESGLRLYIDGLLELGALPEDERREIDTRCALAGRSMESLLHDATHTLSGLSRYAGMVVAPKAERPFKHVEFVPLGPRRALVVLVADSGLVENRMIELPADLPTSSLVEAGNYLTARLAGRSLTEASNAIQDEIVTDRSELGALTRKVVADGLAVWADQPSAQDDGFLIIRGQAQLLDDVTTLADLERIRALFAALEAKRNMLQVVERVQQGEGVQIFLGAETALFGLTGCSLVVAPYTDGPKGDGQSGEILGAIGVIGPQRMNYARIIPMVNHTAQVISRLLGNNVEGSYER